VEMLNIGDAARATGVSAKMIRHYEEVGLLAAPRRTESGYRQYSAAEVHTLRFIRHARDLGFSIHTIGELVGLWQDRKRPSRQVKALAQAHIVELEQKAQEILVMKATLEHLWFTAAKATSVRTAPSWRTWPRREGRTVPSGPSPVAGLASRSDEPADDPGREPAFGRDQLECALCRSGSDS